ncbi:MAG: SufE family protein [Anaerolineales bacterium]|nr:SufE family protein [Anaerolineales bacterium]
MSELPEKLAEIVADFSICQGQEKLEYLLQFAESLPPAPEKYADRRDTHQVHECMSPVWIYAEHENGGVVYHFDIPPEAPTVRGFAAILRQGLNGLPPADIQAVPNEFYLQMGLQHVITGQRLNGMGAILRYMKQLAAAG